MKDRAPQPEALLIAAWLRKSNEEAAAWRIDGAEAIERQHARIEALEASEQQHLQELRSYRITVENREARIAELEAQLAAAHPVFSHMELRADGSHGAGRAVAVDTMGREMPSYNPTAAAQQGVQHGYVLEDFGHAGYLDGQVSRFTLRRADREFLAWIVAAPHADDGEAIAREILNALNATTTAQQGVPKGWQIAPIEPTPEMYDRVMREGYYHDDPEAVKAVLRAEYQDMLAAAPKPPVAHPATQGLEKDARAMVDLLNNREWAEHIGETALGRELEHAITSLYNHANPTTQGLDAQATRYQVGGLTVEWRGNGKWAVVDGCSVLSRNGEWKFEPSPSSRTDEWLAMCRFDSAQEAITAAQAKQGG